ncbi:aromatic amino acid aminotransferase [Aspergillus californicus]
MVSPSPPVDLSHHFSYTTKQRAASEVKDLYKYFSIPGIANLAGGLPNASYFPYDTLEASAARPERFPTIPGGKTKGPQPADRVVVPKESPNALPDNIDLTTALQYGRAEGLPPLAKFVKQFAREHLHPNVPYAGGPDTVLTTGATDGLSKAVEAFTNTWNPNRDWVHTRQGVLCEEFVYMNAIQTIQPRGLNIVPVTLDAEGMLPYGPGGLMDVLKNWDFRRGRRPHLMYTITIGQNPTGGTLSVERRKEIYAICQQFDVIIVEDDPYWNLQFPSAQELQARHRKTPVNTELSKRNYNAAGKSSGYEFLDSLVPSYLSVDTDGRVVRLDTFSKTIAPGCRLGWVTAQPAVIERITRISEVSTQAPSGFVQAMVAELILGQQVDGKLASSNKKEARQGWQMDGWVRWLEGLRAGYEHRMQQMCTLLEENKYIAVDSESDESTLTDDEDSWEILEKSQMIDFSWSTGGMFVWVKVCYENHPLRQKYSPERLSKALWVHFTQKPYLCLLGPGTMFAPTEEIKSRGYQYLRLCFAAMSAEEVVPASERMVEGFRAFWQRKNLDGLEDDTAEAMEQSNHPNGAEIHTNMSTKLPLITNTDLGDEIEAINAIYEPDTITITSSPESNPNPPSTTTIKLQIPNHPHLSFILSFDDAYPDTRPKILGTASTAARGEGKIAIDVLGDILERTWQPGAVCLFDVINGAGEVFGELNIGASAQLTSQETTTTATATADTATGAGNENPSDININIGSLSIHESLGLDSPPEWNLSEVISEKKSVFIGRAAHVTTLDQAQGFIEHLLSTDKKVASATHNISAWRIRQKSNTKPSTSTTPGEMIVQDFDDDGETAAGGRLLHLMQLMDVWDVVVIVTRWYGGVHLGPDRFRIINAAGRDALVKGGFGREKEKEKETGGGEKGKKKGKK